MDNSNSPEYLEKIKVQVIENLKRTAFAPSVQMTDVPRDPEGMNDEADAELDDADEDDNPETRFTKRQWDKYIEKNGELSDSEDEEENHENSVRRQPNAAKRRRNIMDFQNPSAAPEYSVGSLHGSVNGIKSHAASDGERNGVTHSNESEMDPSDGARDESPLSSGNHEDEDDVDMAEESVAPGPAQVDGPQEATPPESPPPVAADPAAPAPVIEDVGNDAMDEGGTIDDPALAKEEGRNEREQEDVTSEKTTEVMERSEE